ncbi:MAG: 4-(cytidine 5'-diphospho)-2-C-methyl-D-erythritol kinase [Acidimicrobiales bacterium]|jgi:4-diphosphocytidyl-2-C-methyl-D-erythritol kinase
MPTVDHLRAPAKLTRSLRIVGVRDDGYHLLEAEMATIELADELEIEAGADGFELVDELAFVVGGDGAAPGDAQGRDGTGALGVSTVPPGQDNLVLRALAAVGRRARVKLKKRIPAGAGLGGGSSDAAAVLRWAGALDPDLAARLGADVPFCVVGGRALVTGIGERVEALAFEPFTAVLVTPALSVATPAVYKAWDTLGGPVGEHGNDLEPAALVFEPRLAWWRDLFSDVAGARPHLAGSGGTWYLERPPQVAGRLVAELKQAVQAEHARALVVAAASTPAPERP